MKMMTVTQNAHKVVAPTRLAGDEVQSLRSGIEKALGSDFDLNVGALHGLLKQWKDS